VEVRGEGFSNGLQIPENSRSNSCIRRDIVNGHPDDSVGSIALHKDLTHERTP